MTILASVIVGILLLTNPAKYAIAIIKIAGIVLIALAVHDFLRYFRAKPEEAAKGSAFYSGMLETSVGLFCIFGSDWFLGAFPILTVLYSLLASGSCSEWWTRCA